MKLTSEITESSLIVRLEGELDHHSAAEVRAKIDQMIDTSERKNLIFSFQGVTFMDSAGIGVVMGRYNKMKEIGGKVMVSECNDYAKRILEMSGLFTIAPYCGTVEQAIKTCGEMQSHME
ncbi:anti-sigma F factor antagonist [Sinanaerobacter sp. ZZT-01]|uniref:anti-sigma F factor antagonist n=1 Tax=Sinanaerobacter sp. ZZT-01 TaxID=3111540 RepID=UPI002D78DCBE|nr:anti-sigma F factor antagonist [Sinanaerobacter sp. ZZT-01]WRR92648.1 anti-sigma F factor antagonist [Sinanaerobacter sp. ZZT-01]